MNQFTLISYLIEFAKDEEIYNGKNCPNMTERPLRSCVANQGNSIYIIVAISKVMIS